MIARWLVLLAVVLAVAGAPSSAAADGDPASDTLLYQDSFLPYQPTVTPAVAKKLDAAIKAARAKGLPVKVAVVAGEADMGAIPYLLDRPQEYADFLFSEIAFQYPRGALVVVSPKGVGLAASRVAFQTSTPLADLAARKGGDVDALARTATEAVEKLAAAYTGDAGGITAVAPGAAQLPDGGAQVEGSSRTWGRWLVVALAIGVLLLTSGAAWLRARRRPS